MTFISIFMMFTFFMSFIIFILAVLHIIKKIGMTLLARKLNISNYMLLWIPGLGALYEGKLMNKFLKYGKNFEIGYFTMITIIRIIWLIFFLFGPKYNEASFDIISSIISDIESIIFLIDIVFKSITLKKNEYNIFISVIICIFLSPFWCFFVNKKIKKHTKLFTNDV